jgi:hypothetical protein
MSEGPVCKTCSDGELSIQTIRRHGELAAAFGTILVLLAILTSVVLVIAFLVEARRASVQDVAILVLCITGASAVGAFGAVVRQTRSLLVCSTCGAISDAAPPALLRMMQSPVGPLDQHAKNESDVTGQQKSD